MVILFLIFPIIGAVIGGFELLNTVTHAESAPQQAAGAALAAACAVVPYCLARAVQEIKREVQQEKEKEQAP